MPAQPQEIDQQKAALLTAIAQQGQQGQQAFAAEAARRAAAQQAAVAAVTQQSKMTGAAGNAPKEFTQQLQQKQTDLGNIYAQDAAMSGQTFANSIAQTGAANAAYMDQARAAIPIVNAQTAGTVAQIRAEQQAAAEERAFQAEQRRIQAEEDAKDRAFAEQQRQWEIEDRNATADDEKTAQDQQGIVTRANASDPVVGSVVDALTKDAPDFRTAVVALDSYVKQALAGDETGAARKSWEASGGEKKREILRLLYRYYDPADKGGGLPNDPQEIGKFLRSQHLDPKRHVPGYMYDEDILKQEAIEQKAKEQERRNKENYRKAAAALRKLISEKRKKDSGKSRPQDYLPGLPGGF